MLCVHVERRNEDEKHFLKHTLRGQMGKIEEQQEK